MWTCLVFFNEARTDYYASGYFRTMTEAETHAEKLRRERYGDRAKVEVTQIISSPLN